MTYGSRLVERLKQNSNETKRDKLARCSFKRFFRNNTQPLGYQVSATSLRGVTISTTHDWPWPSKPGRAPVKLWTIKNALVEQHVKVQQDLSQPQHCKWTQLLTVGVWVLRTISFNTTVLAQIWAYGNRNEGVLHTSWIPEYGHELRTFSAKLLIWEMNFRWSLTCVLTGQPVRILGTLAHPGGLRLRCHRSWKCFVIFLTACM